MPAKIYPKCKLKQDTHMALTYEGYVVPCCMIAGDAFKQIKALLGDKVNQLHISSGTIDEINRSEAMYQLDKSFELAPLRQCIKICSSRETLNSKFQGCNTPNQNIEKGRAKL